MNYAKIGWVCIIFSFGFFFVGASSLTIFSGSWYWITTFLFMAAFGLSIGGSVFFSMGEMEDIRSKKKSGGSS